MAERFQTTQWSIVVNAGAGGADARRALTVLCETYRPAVLSYVRARVRNQDDAEDLTQAFFTHVLERQLPGRADPERGRFRSFLLTSLNHFFANERERSNAQRRGGNVTLIGEEVIETVDGEGDDPERAFELEWARTVLREAMRRLEQEAETAGRGRMFAEFRPYLTENPEPGDYDRIAENAGIRRNTIAVAVHRMRSRLQELVQDVIADTATDNAAIQAELRRFRETKSSTGKPVA